MAVGTVWEPSRSCLLEQQSLFAQSLSKWSGLLTVWRWVPRASSRQTSPGVQVALPVSACVMLAIGPMAKISVVVEARVSEEGD